MESSLGTRIVHIIYMGNSHGPLGFRLVSTRGARTPGLAASPPRDPFFLGSRRGNQTWNTWLWLSKPMGSHFGW